MLVTTLRLNVIFMRQIILQGSKSLELLNSTRDNELHYCAMCGN